MNMLKKQGLNSNDKRLIKKIKFEVEIRFVTQNKEQSNPKRLLVHLIRKYNINTTKVREQIEVEKTKVILSFMEIMDYA